MNKEKFKPISNTKENSFFGQLKFYGRMALDFQFLTIYKHLKEVLPTYTGKVLDIGCGQSPYKYMLPKEADYFGIDVEIANSEFNYNNEAVTFFDGKNIPFENNTFDAILCTEVLEHVYEHQYLVNEMYRVLKPGAKAMVTIPFSARYHYIPYDYFRYTPSTLKNIFAAFKIVNIKPRGSDIIVISNKLIVLIVRNLKSLNIILLLPILPIVFCFILISHVLLWLNLNKGGHIDPLGYTIILEK